MIFNSESFDELNDIGTFALFEDVDLCESELFHFRGLFEYIFRDDLDGILLSIIQFHGLIHNTPVAVAKHLANSEVMLSEGPVGKVDFPLLHNKYKTSTIKVLYHLMICKNY